MNRIQNYFLNPLQYHHHFQQPNLNKENIMGYL